MPKPFMMSKKLTICFLILLTLVIFSRCSRSHHQSEILFGIQVAQKELWDEAVFRWEKAVRENPSSAAAHNNLAVAYEKKGMMEKAREEYERALQLSPQNSYIKSNYENFKKNQEKEKKELPDENK